MHTHKKKHVKCTASLKKISLKLKEVVKSEKQQQQKTRNNMRGLIRWRNGTASFKAFDFST